MGAFTRAYLEVSGDLLDSWQIVYSSVATGIRMLRAAESLKRAIACAADAALCAHDLPRVRRLLAALLEAIATSGCAD